MIIIDESDSTHYLYDDFDSISTKTQKVIARSASYTVGCQYGTSGSDTGHLIAIT